MARNEKVGFIRRSQVKRAIQDHMDQRENPPFVMLRLSAGALSEMEKYGELIVNRMCCAAIDEKTTVISASHVRKACCFLADPKDVKTGKERVVK
ncbi:MAG: hypothetical protein M0Z52_07420 [Actinomycetota bacterium]|nr:hypothetical protein [Actinomycetota bacterium]